MFTKAVHQSSPCFAYVALLAWSAGYACPLAKSTSVERFDLQFIVFDDAGQLIMRSNKKNRFDKLKVD